MVCLGSVEGDAEIREVVSLDGVWAIAQGRMDEIPSSDAPTPTRIEVTIINDIPKDFQGTVRFQLRKGEDAQFSEARGVTVAAPPAGPPRVKATTGLPWTWKIST